MSHQMRVDLENDVANGKSSDNSTNHNPHRSGENFDLSAEIFHCISAPLNTRVNVAKKTFKFHRLYYMIVVKSRGDREVLIEEPATGVTRPTLMFGSNNYLGLASHPYIQEQVVRAIERWGVGIGGPPFLNGYIGQARALEERLAHEKQQEACLIYASGFSANLPTRHKEARRFIQ